MSIALRDAIQYAKKGASSIQPGPPSLPESAESLQQTTLALRLERLSGRRKSFNWEKRTYKEQSTRSCSSFNEDATKSENKIELMQARHFFNQIVKDLVRYHIDLNASPLSRSR